MQTQNKQSWIKGLSQVEGEACLANLQMLSAELNSAIRAIVERRLSSLQGSLHLQQVSCGQLTELQHRSMDRLRQSSDAENEPLDADLALEIEAATEALLLLNSRYSALLKHSGDTLRLLAGLYRSYRGFARPASGTQTSLPTWSCRI